MKKYLNIILLALFLLIPVRISAEGYISVSPSSLTIEQGSSKTFTITAYNTIGDITISSNNTAVASVNTSEWGTGMVDEKQTKSGTITVTGNSVGTTTIILVIDAATFDSEDLAGQTKTVSINVVAKPTQEISQPTTDSTPIQKPTPGVNQPTPNYPANNLSDNNNIKELSIDGFELIKIDDTNYTLSVGNHINKLNIKATSEDNKSKVDGIGEKELSVGQNDFIITVTSENGSVKQYHILITRKEDKYYLKDIDDFISSDSDTLLLIDNDLISEEIILKLKKLNKKIKLTKLNQNNKVIYEFIIDTKNLKKSFNTEISFESKNNINEKTNYAQGLSLVVDKNIPKGTKLNFYINNKFTKGDIVNIYKYSKNNLNLINKVTVDNEYISFDLSGSEEYFLTQANLTNKKSNSNNKIILIISFLIVFILIAILIYFLLKKSKSNKQNNKNSVVSEIQDDTINNSMKKSDVDYNFDNNLQLDNQKEFEVIGIDKSTDEINHLNYSLESNNVEQVSKNEFIEEEKNNSDSVLGNESQNNSEINKIKKDIDDLKNRYF